MGRSNEAVQGINFFGSFSGNMGLGVAARNWLGWLLEDGVDVHAIDVPDPSGRSGHDDRFRGLAQPLDAPAPHPVNFFALSPWCLARLLAEGHAALDVARCQNVMVPFWELPRLPAEWRATLSQIDVVIASTRFIADAFREAAVVAEVEYVPLPLEIGSGAARDRERWGASEEDFVLVTSFELVSDAERKNPWAAIEAFARAFPGETHARLFIKLNNSDLAPELAEPARRLRALADRDPRITLVDTVLPYDDVLSLYATADAYVSLHRAEGLGLGMLESMALGTPVIATGWSGNLDYLNDANSCLVDYLLVPVRAGTQVAYAADRIDAEAQWAEPDIDSAAAWMRRLADDPAFGRSIADRALADFRARRMQIGLDGVRAALARTAHRRRA